MSVLDRRAAVMGAAGVVAAALAPRPAGAQTASPAGLRVYDITDPAFAGGAGPARPAAVNTAAIRSAAAAVEARGGILFVPPGRYLVAPDPATGGVLDLRDHLEVHFAAGAWWVCPGTSPPAHLVRGVGVRGVTLRGVCLAGAAAPGSDRGPSTGISVWGSTDVRIERCRVERIDGTGILVAPLGGPTTAVAIEHCHVDACAGDGIHVAGGHGIAVRSTTVTACHRGLAIGPAGEGTRDVTVAASTFARSAGPTGGAGIDAGFDPGTHGVLVDGTRVVDNAGNGIQGGVGDLVVTGTTSARNRGAGLGVLGGDATVTGNRFVDNQRSAVAGLATHALVAANLCSGNGGGLDVHGSGCVVEANRLAPFRAPTPLHHRDLSGSHPALVPIEWLAATGITTSTTFAPDSELDRAVLAAWFHATRLLAGDPAAVFYTPPATPTFLDVPATKAYYVGVEWVAAWTLMDGYSDGRFRPGSAVGRAALADFWHRLAGRPAPPPGAPTFADVPASHPYAAAIRWAAAAGYVTGSAGGAFRPGDPATRADAAASLHLHYWKDQPTWPS